MCHQVLRLDREILALFAALLRALVLRINPGFIEILHVDDDGSVLVDLILLVTLGFEWLVGPLDPALLKGLALSQAEDCILNGAFL